MQHIQAHQPFGTVIVPSTGAPRYLSFYQALDRLHVPQGTRLLYAISSDLTMGLNQAMEGFIGEWVFLLGDDHTYHPDLLMRLLGWNLPAVTGLNIGRVSPFKPIVSIPGQRLAEWSEIPTDTALWYPPRGWVPGNAGMLIRRSVIEQMDKPYFMAGQILPHAGCEDLYFVQQVQKVTGGVPVDLGAILGHTNHFAVTPQLTERGWEIGLVDQQNNCVVTIPGPTPPAPGGVGEEGIADATNSVGTTPIVLGGESC